MITGTIHPIFATKWFALIPPANDSEKGMCNCNRTNGGHDSYCSRYPNPRRQSKTQA
ncbi:hypothetical protein MYO4S_00057 [Serratia phage 4S]|nr:hypothetical protein MYO4S_00057 [Serratia phage 4S]